MNSGVDVQHNKHFLSYFVLKVVLLMPLLFAVWYLLAGYHLAPVVFLSDVVVKMWMPEALMWLRLDGHTLILASNFGHDATGKIVSPPVGQDLLGFHLNPLVYCYSLPLLSALTLAVPGPDKWVKLLWGLILLLPFELFSMIFSVMKTLTFDVGSAFQVQQGISALQADAIALAYQLGVLIVPMVTPLIIWIALHRRFLLLLAPQLGQLSC